MTEEQDAKCRDNEHRQHIRLQCIHAVMHPSLPQYQSADEVLDAAALLLAFVEGTKA